MLQILFRLHLFFILVTGLLAQGFVFVQPIARDESRPVNLRNVLNVEVQGKKALAFEEISTPDLEALKARLQRSGLIQRVLSMRAEALEVRSHLGLESSFANQPERFAVYVGDAFGATGPAVASGLRIALPQSGDTYDSLMILSDLKMKGVILTIDDFDKNRYLPAVIAHELFHAITGDLYGDAFFELKASSTSNRGHDSHLKTDPFLAWLEGMAEAMEVLALRDHQNEISLNPVDTAMSPMAKAMMQGFMHRRLKLASKNSFIFDQDGSVLDGNLDSALDMIRTEGVVAGVFYRLVFEALDGDYRRAFETIARHKPMNIVEFASFLAEDWPDSRSSILRCFVENTRYVTVSQEALELYRDSYLHTKDFKTGSGSRDQSQISRERWLAFRSDMFAGILAGKIQMDQALPKPYIVSDDYGFFQVDLNAANPIDIQGYLEDQASLELAEAELMAMKIARSREKVLIEDMDDLSLPAEIEKILAQGNLIYRGKQRKQMLERAQKLQEGFYSGYASEEGLNSFVFHSISDL